MSDQPARGESLALVGVDVGGTYTDIIASTGQRTVIRKVASTPSKPQSSVFTALRSLVEDDLKSGEVVHGATLATNAVITRSGAKVALLTTRGFRDLLEMRRRDRPKAYGLDGTFNPLVARHWRLEVAERTLSDGTVETPVDVEEALAALSALDSPPEAVAVFFLNSYRNAENEKAMGEALREAGYRYVSLSHQVSAETGEFERLSTTVVNAFLQPLMSDYLGNIRMVAHEERLADEILMLHGNGGAMTLELAGELPVRTVMSGPAGGVLAAQWLGKQTGCTNLMTCDMGGTSFDASLIVNGRTSQSPQTQIEFGIPIRATMTEIITIGAGGGSICWIDRGGLLQVGPDSAGADPGPACYGRGGDQPTVTDANLVLGRINPGEPIGDLASLDVAAAEVAIKNHLAGPLNLPVEEAALAMLEVANFKMASALRLISVERGHDPADFVLVPFGGGGSLHACSLMRSAGIPKALIPRFPGVLSAIGAMIAEYQHNRVRTVFQLLEDISDADVVLAFRECHTELVNELHETGLNVNEGTTPGYAYEAGYQGQVHVLSVALGTSEPESIDDLRNGFEREYEQEFGALLDLPIVIHSVSVALRKPRLLDEMGRALAGATPDVERSNVGTSRRNVRFVEGWFETDVVRRESIADGRELRGPIIIEQDDTTVLIEPGFSATSDSAGNLHVKYCDGAN